MDPIENPFSPGAGSPPPELVGRAPVVEQARVLFGRVRAGRPEKSILLTGLRGVGKTVLLNEMERMAERAGFDTIPLEAQEGAPLGHLLAPAIRRLLFDLDRAAATSRKVRRGLAVLRSFLGALQLTYEGVTIGLDVDPERGAADSGDLAVDLPYLLVAVGEAAADRGRSVAILIDEIQYFNSNELGALIMAMHRLQQRQLPLVLLGAGLPILPGLAGESKSYAERLFSFPDVGALSPEDAARALRGPVQKLGVQMEDEAIAEIYRMTMGYPYFLQEWGYQSWNTAESSPITVSTIKAATDTVIDRLDHNFFRVRFDRLTAGQKRFLRAMAELGGGPYRTSDVAETLGVKVSSLGPQRALLIQKGMIYSPAHGEMAFTVPLFEGFMKRAMPRWEP